MVLRYLRSFFNPEGIRYDILEIKRIVVLRFSKTGDPDKIFYPEHAKVLVQVCKVPLQGPVIKISTGIIGAIDPQIMIGIIFQVYQCGK